MRFGFAGIKHPHAKGWADAAGAVGGTIVAVYDPSPEEAAAFAAERGAVTVDSVAALGEHDLDAVVVDGRCDELAAMALGVIELGLPFMLEKPGAMTAAEMATIAEAAAAKGLPSQLGYFLRYGDPVLEARRALDAGELGRVTLLRIHAAMPDKAWTVMGPWFSDPTNITSIFQEDACHVVDIARFLLGNPRGVVAQRIAGHFEPSVGEDAIGAVLDYGDAIGMLDFTAREANAWIETWSVELYGTQGTMRFGLAPAWLERYQAGQWRLDDEPRIPEGISDGFARNYSTAEVYRRGMEGLVRAIRGEAPAPIDVAAGLEVFRTVEAIQRAADTGRRIAVELAPSPVAAR